MANALYDLGRQGFLDGSFNWSAATVKACLVNASYTPNLATDEFLADIPGGDIVATSSAFTGKTVAGGVADADDITFTAVGAGPAADFVVIYEDTGSPSTSRLIAKIDTATGLPVTPSGGDIAVVWDSGANKIFKL